MWFPCGNPFLTRWLSNQYSNIFNSGFKDPRCAFCRFSPPGPMNFSSFPRCHTPWEDSYGRCLFVERTPCFVVLQGANTKTHHFAGSPKKGHAYQVESTRILGTSTQLVAVHQVAATAEWRRAPFAARDSPPPEMRCGVPLKRWFPPGVPHPRALKKTRPLKEWNFGCYLVGSLTFNFLDVGWEQGKQLAKL